MLFELSRDADQAFTLRQETLWLFRVRASACGEQWTALARCGFLKWMAPTVLLVDDDETLRSTVAVALRAKGHEVIEASNGLQAYRLLTDAERLPDVVLLDMLMPGMSGGEFIVAMARNPRLAAVPVVVISAHDDAQDVDGFEFIKQTLRKPFAPTELLHAIEVHSAKAS